MYVCHVLGRIEVRGLNLRLSLRPVPGFGKPGVRPGSGEILIGSLDWFWRHFRSDPVQTSTTSAPGSFWDFSASISAALLGESRVYQVLLTTSFAGTTVCWF